MSYVAPSITASGTTFAQFQAGGASGHLERLITAQAATVAPTVAPTGNATGGGASGGLLAAGTYYFVITETNGIGETTISPQSAQMTVAATDIPQITFPALKPGNTARNLYVGAVNGLTGGPYYLYASNIVAGTYNMAVAAPSNSYAVQPPTANSTGLTFANAAGTVTTNKALSLIRAAKDGNLADVYQFLRGVIEEFNSGQPVPFGGSIQKLRHAHTALQMLATLCSEMGTLIDANPGTLATTVAPIGTPRVHRTWP